MIATSKQYQQENNNNNKATTLESITTKAIGAIEVQAIAKTHVVATTLVEITITIETHAIAKATTIVKLGMTIEAHVEAKTTIIVEVAATTGKAFTVAKAPIVQ